MLVVGTILGFEILYQNSHKKRGKSQTNLHALPFVPFTTRCYKISQGIESPCLSCVGTGQFCNLFFPPPLFVPITKRIFTKSCHKWHKFTEVISSSLESRLGSSGTSNPSPQFMKMQELF